MSDGKKTPFVELRAVRAANSSLDAANKALMLSIEFYARELEVLMEDLSGLNDEANKLNEKLEGEYQMREVMTAAHAKELRALRDEACAAAGKAQDTMTRDMHRIETLEAQLAYAQGEAEVRRSAAPCTPLGAVNLELFGRPAKEMHHEAFHVLSVLSEWAGTHSFEEALKALKKRLHADPGNPW